uniref:Uncharacterized protein n=1 Tax=Rhizophora mucronata TaxID=61149 RepID=A0A2P2NS62_RHIMU
MLRFYKFKNQQLNKKVTSIISLNMLIDY